MTEIETDVLKELEIAQGAVAHGEGEGVEGVEAPVMEELEKAEALLAVGAGGGGTAKHALVDYYFTSGLRRIWAYIPGTGWKNRNISEGQVATIGKVVMEADRVDTYWSDSQITMLRSWKTF
jgi:hypothetical protein